MHRSDRRRRIAGAVGGLLLAAVASLADPQDGEAQRRVEAGGLVVESSAELLRREAAAANGDDEGAGPVPRRLPWHQALPGEEIIVTVAFTNASGRIVHDARISTAIPDGFAYVAGSAQGPAATVLFSIDGGESFAPSAELFVSDQDGERVAGADAYTHLRWLLPGPFDPGVRGFVRYRARAE
jgi:uncharacterized repeat protein (TIGR01451 family)